MWAESRAVAALLVEYGADIAARTTNGETPLIQAAESGHLEVVQYLLEQGANLEERGNSGRTALTAAVRNNRHDVVAFLRSVGASIAPPPAGVELQQTLFGAAALAMNEDFLRELIAAGWTPSSLSEEWPTLLVSILHQGKTHQGFSLAAAKRGVATARLLLELGADPNAHDQHGIPLLHTAVQIGYTGLVDALLAAGADPNSLDADGRTPLLHAMDRHTALAKPLLDAGANPKDRYLSLGGYLALCMFGFLSALLPWRKYDALAGWEDKVGCPTWSHNLVLSVLLAVLFSALVHFAMRVDFWYGTPFHWQIALTMEGPKHYYPLVTFGSLDACMEEIAGRKIDAFFPDLLPYNVSVTNASCWAGFSFGATWISASMICYVILGLIAGIGRRGGRHGALSVLIPSYILVFVLSPYPSWIRRVPQGGLEDIFSWKEVAPNALFAIVISISLAWLCAMIKRGRTATKNH